MALNFFRPKQHNSYPGSPPKSLARNFQEVCTADGLDRRSDPHQNRKGVVSHEIFVHVWHRRPCRRILLYGAFLRFVQCKKIVTSNRVVIAPSSDFISGGLALRLITTAVKRGFHRDSYKAFSLGSIMCWRSSASLNGLSSSRINLPMRYWSKLFLRRMRES